MIPQLTIGLSIALAASLAGNAWQVHAYLGVRDERTQAEAARDQAAGAATMCSDATEALQDLAKTRQLESAQAVASAARAGERRGRRAAEILAKPPTRPGDDCGSARDRVDAWLIDRGQP